MFEVIINATVAGERVFLVIVTDWLVSGANGPTHLAGTGARGDLLNRDLRTVNRGILDDNAS